MEIKYLGKTDFDMIFQTVGQAFADYEVPLNRNDSVKFINTNVLYNSITGFLKAKNIDVTGKQFEMIKKI